MLRRSLVRRAIPDCDAETHEVREIRYPALPSVAQALEAAPDLKIVELGDSLDPFLGRICIKLPQKSVTEVAQQSVPNCLRSILIVR